MTNDRQDRRTPSDHSTINAIAAFWEILSPRGREEVYFAVLGVLTRDMDRPGAYGRPVVPVPAPRPSTNPAGLRLVQAGAGPRARRAGDAS